MGRAVIHIGSGKTGSTALQRALFEASRSDGLAGFDYPAVKGRHHRDLYILFKQKEAVARNLKSRVRSGEIDYGKYRKAYERAFSDGGLQGRDLILSSEYLFDLSAKNILALKELTDRLGVTDYLVVAFVRHPASYYLSYVQQRLKASHVIPNPNRFRYPIKSVVSAWRRVFKNVVVRDFDELAERNEDVVESFAGIIKRAGWGDVTLGSWRANPGLCAEAMVLMQRYRQRFHSECDNVFQPDSDGLLRVVTELSAAGSRPRLRDDVEAAISSRHENDIVYLQKEFGLFGKHGLNDGSASRIDWKSERLVPVERILKGLNGEAVQNFSLSAMRKLLAD